MNDEWQCLLWNMFNLTLNNILLGCVLMLTTNTAWKRRSQAIHYSHGSWAPSPHSCLKAMLAKNHEPFSPNGFQAPQPVSLHASCNILRPQPVILHAICNILGPRFPSLATLSKTVLRDCTSLCNHTVLASLGVRGFSLEGFHTWFPNFPRSCLSSLAS